MEDYLKIKSIYTVHTYEYIEVLKNPGTVLLIIFSDVGHRVCGRSEEAHAVLYRRNRGVPRPQNNTGPIGGGGILRAKRGIFSYMTRLWTPYGTSLAADLSSQKETTDFVKFILPSAFMT